MAESKIDGQILYDDPTPFEQDLQKLINYYSQENSSDTPDFILAEYLVNCLNAFSISVRKRDKWYHQEKFDGYSIQEDKR
jgi:hypothetical protein